jgi:hypothetical protein
MSSSQFLRKDSVSCNLSYVSVNQAFSLRKERRNIAEEYIWRKKDIKKTAIGNANFFSFYFVGVFISISDVVCVKQTCKFKQLVQNIDGKFQWKRPCGIPRPTGWNMNVNVRDISDLYFQNHTQPTTDRIKQTTCFGWLNHNRAFLRSVRKC